jgi:penicillin-binding protein 1A
MQAKSPPTQEKPAPLPRRPWRRVLLWVMVLLALAFLAAGAGGVALFLYIDDGLPQISNLGDYRPPIVSTVYADDGQKIGEFYNERRFILPLAEMPPLLVQAFIAAEDSRFYAHQGVDLQSILRAMYKNFAAGTIVQGGSTITQQVTKSFFLTPERSYVRKLKEAILAYRINRAFTKDEVLFLYLNQIYLGHGAYGVEAAAQNYFGKSVLELNLAECAMLAGLPQAPSRYSPYHHRDRARQRQLYVLNRMLEEGFITPEQADNARETHLDIHARPNFFQNMAPFYAEHVRQYVEKKYGVEALYREGLQIYTAVNVAMQQAGSRAIEQGLRELDKRQGYRGPQGNLPPAEADVFLAGRASETEEPGRSGSRLVLEAIVKGVVTEVNDGQRRVAVKLAGGQGIIALEDLEWARKPDLDGESLPGRIRLPSQVLKTGDVIEVRLKELSADGLTWHLALEQWPKAQSALLCIEAQSGHVKAMLGGSGFATSQYNRAVQSRRQPGSAFKPVIYAAALDKGYTPASVIIDAPIVFEDAESEFTWKPKNYRETFYGPTRLREALAQSRNVVTVKILRDIGIDYAIDYARRLGIQSTLNRDLSIALGSSGVSLLEIVNAYSVFANQGYRIDPVFVTRILNRQGQVLEEAAPEREKVIEKTTAYLMNSLLQSVVEEGTGQRVKVLNRPVAGKTGTTNNLYDAWFVGYTPDLIVGAWVGFDEEGSLGQGETGARAAIPIWLAFMQQVLDGRPIRDFEVPEDIVFARIDAETGLLAIPQSKKTIFESFKDGTVPTAHTKPPDGISDAEDFFKTGF